MDFQQRFKGKISLMTKDGIQGQITTFTAQNSDYNSNKQFQQIKSSINPQNAQKVYFDQLNDYNQVKDQTQLDNIQNVNYFNKHAQQIICNTHYLHQQPKENELKRGFTADGNTEQINKYNLKHNNRNQKSLDYLPYTYKDYQKIQNQKVNKSGGLGPNIQTDEWKDKKQKAQKAQEFSLQIQLNNKEKYMFQNQQLTERDQPQNMKHPEFIQYLQKIKNQKQS